MSNIDGKSGYFTKAEIAKILKTKYGISYTESQLRHIKREDLMAELGQHVTESVSAQKKANKKKSSFKQILKKMFRRSGY